MHFGNSLSNGQKEDDGQIPNDFSMVRSQTLTLALYLRR